MMNTTQTLSLLEDTSRSLVKRVATMVTGKTPLIKDLEPYFVAIARTGIFYARIGGTIGGTIGGAIGAILSTSVVGFFFGFIAWSLLGALGGALLGELIGVLGGMFIQMGEGTSYAEMSQKFNRSAVEEVLAGLVYGLFLGIISGLFFGLIIGVIIGLFSFL